VDLLGHILALKRDSSRDDKMGLVVAHFVGDMSYILKEVFFLGILLIVFFWYSF